MSFNLASKQQGQALPEMVIVFPLVVILVMAILQIALLYRGKATLNNATFLAARSGSLNHGFTGNMESVFWDRMAALGQIRPELRSNATTGGLYNSPNALNLAATRAALAVSHLYRPIEIIWPTKEVFNHFAVPYRPLESCSGASCPFSSVGGGFRLANSSVFQIPLENQDARVQTMQLVGDRNVDLQDANLLSIKSRYCYDLEVPVANFIIWRTLQFSQGFTADWRACQLVGLQYGENRFVIPMTGHSIVRMQTGFRCEGDENVGSNCENI